MDPLLLVPGLRARQVTCLRPALQTHWFQIHDGEWLAAITVYVTDAAGTNSLELDMIVTADAISERPSV